jgi:hypothetical protein
MNWFRALTGFDEAGPEATRAQFELADRVLRSRANGRSWDVGELEIVSLQSLRQRVAAAAAPAGRLEVRSLVGDARALHRDPARAGALFQVASQFNLLEMASPAVTPEQGITGYAHDRTQGPACAMAAAAGTIYRNYFVPVQGQAGQSAHRQINTFSALATALEQACALPGAWRTSNGYAFADAAALQAFGRHLAHIDEAERNRLRGLLAIGWHREVEVTDVADPPRPRVSQAYCSALPVAYGDAAPALWAPVAQLVLEAAYEATLCAALLGNRHVLLTRLGGGVFGNADDWIGAAIGRALGLARGRALQVELVSFGREHPQLQALAAAHR